jgi:hypothetical protein
MRNTKGGLASMGLYEDSSYHIDDALAAFHDDELDSFARPGTWLTGEERTAVAHHARVARCQAGVQEAGEADASVEEDVLPDALRSLITQVAVAPRDLDRSYFEKTQAAEISDTEYTETVGIVSRVANLDVFARGLGIPMRPLRAPLDGEPALERPATAIDEGAWVPTIPCDERGGEIGKALYGGNMQPFIYRALSLVPLETQRLLAGGDLQYLPLDKFFDFSYSHHAALSRPQLEIVAGRVSALNGCFY